MVCCVNIFIRIKSPVSMSAVENLLGKKSTHTLLYVIFLYFNQIRIFKLLPLFNQKLHCLSEILAVPLSRLVISSFPYTPVHRCIEVEPEDIFRQSHRNQNSQKKYSKNIQRRKILEISCSSFNFLCLGLKKKTKPKNQPNPQSFTFCSKTGLSASGPSETHFWCVVSSSKKTHGHFTWMRRIMIGQNSMDSHHNMEIYNEI